MQLISLSPRSSIGMLTLYKREVWRFMKVWNQTILAPVITTLLFLAVLTLASGGITRTEHGIPYQQFLAPGLIMMAIVQNAFANTSTSLILAKVQGTIIDILMPPFRPWELTSCLALGGVTRGLCVCVSVFVAMCFVMPVQVAHPFLAFIYVFLSALMLAQIGILSGIWANGFDQMSAISNYIITPLSFLSGTFYSIQHLPAFWQQVSHYNPFFYMIDGFRYAFTNQSDGSISTGLIVLTAINILLACWCSYLFARGTRLKN